MKLHWRVWVLIFAIILSVIFIAPRPWHEGVAITAVATGSPAAEAGLAGPSAGTPPVARERILGLNGIEVATLEDYGFALSTVEPGMFVQVLTNKDSYALNIPNATNQTNQTAVTEQDLLGIRISEPPTTNIRKGLDLTGGARVLLQPEEAVDDETMDLVLRQIEERLNVFGLSDVVVRPTQDFSGAQYILVEVAGVNEQEIIELLSRQGHFSARVGNTTVFTGGDDITYVASSATEAYIEEPRKTEGGYVAPFSFGISLSGPAAERFADATRDLSVVSGPNGGYLNESIVLLLDGENVSSLQIAAGLQGRPETQIQISGSEVGATPLQAAENAQDEMRFLQTVMSTGSLPVELQMVKSDAISPALGHQFIRNIWIVALVAILAVIAVVASRYREWKVAIPMIIAMLSEVVIVLGIAAVIGWNLDLAAIAGILVAIGTGVDDQIIIVDEVKSRRKEGSWKSQIKKAFFIIFAAFFTLLAAMLPLMWAGAGLVRGFAITTVLGVTVGVLVTRPAFAVLVERIIGDKA